MDTGASANIGPAFNSATSTATQAFAIPISTALTIARPIENGSASRTVHVGATAFLGIEIDPSSSNPFAGNDNGAQGTTSGVTIAQTVPNTPAAKSALISGDTIVSVNGQSVTTITSLDGILATLKPGDSIRAGYTNTSGVQATLDLALGSGPPQ